MDAAIYHPTRTSIFSVRSGYVFEYSLALAQLATSKFVNPCFSKSCMAYDSVNDKLWIGTQGDWAMGRGGDNGGSQPSLSQTGLYRLDPASLALELFVDPQIVNWGNLSATNPGSDNGKIFAYGGQSGFYDLLFANSKIYGCFYGMNFSPVSNNTGILVSFSPTAPTVTNVRFTCPDLPLSQCAYETANTPPRIWAGAQDSDLWTADPPAAIGNDWAVGYNLNHNPFSSPTGGVHGAIAYSSVGGGFVYMVQLNNTHLVKYNVNGTVNSVKAMAGASLGGMTVKIRFNPADNLLYIPCPATNQVIQYDPSTDAVVKIWTSTDGLDAPHDMVFALTRKYAVQFGSVGLKELT